LILDASAVIAYLFQEPGNDVVQRHLAGAAMSAVNLTEVITRVMREGATPTEALELTDSLDLRVFPWDDGCVRRASQLSQLAWTMGLSLGDRACLATAMGTGSPILTAERNWRKLPNLGLEIQWIR
jgi:PIN domain nuclease of toxin-antitoxin system